MQWLMLQQDEPRDYVIATGRQFSVRDFVDEAAKGLGLVLEWKGKGVEETGIVAGIDASVFSRLHSSVSSFEPDVAVGDVIVKVDPRYFRPTEVETLLGDPAMAKEELGWEPATTFEQMVAEMVQGGFCSGSQG